MPSAKTAVIEHIFRSRFDTKNGNLTSDIVTFEDLQAAIHATGANLKTNNIANFWKDLTRSDPNRVWPTAVLAKGYTGTDAIGVAAGASFQFVKLPRGQRTAFNPPPSPPAAMIRSPHLVQSLSIPLAARALGRRDESWLAQVAQRLALIETHFAVASTRRIVEVDFLQTNLKIGKSEVDVLYLVTDDSGARFLVAVEAKGLREGLWVHQVARAALVLAGRPEGKSVAGVIPFAIKVIGKSVVHTIEFDPVTGTALPKVASQAVIRLRPDVPGID